MPDCTVQYQDYQTALAAEAVKTAYWAVKAAEAYLAQLDMQAAQMLTMQKYQAYLACMMGGMRIPPSPSLEILETLAAQASESLAAARKTLDSLGG